MKSSRFRRLKQLRSNLRLVFSWLLLLLAITSLIAIPSAQAISKTGLNSILRNTPFYGDTDLASLEGCVTGSATVDAALVGSDAQQQSFNFFIKMGLNEVESAAITANLMAESGLNTSANQASGPGMGIAQWSNPGRWNTLEQYATQQGADKFDMTLQLSFVWAELNGTVGIDGAGNYSAVLAKFKEMAEATPPEGFTNVEIAVGFIMGTQSVRLDDERASQENDPAIHKFMDKFGRVDGFESPGIPYLTKRIANANDTLTNYGTEGGASVTGASAACGSVGAVNCQSDGSADAASNGSLSKVRQDVVCIAQQELAKWQSGEMGPGDSYLTYTAGASNVEWCAYFASWVYNQAGYPLTGGTGGAEGRVVGIEAIGQDNGKFTYHAAGDYVPEPGDIAIHTSGQSHVNIVVSVNSKDKTMVVVGGNQGSIQDNSKSLVTSYDIKGFSNVDGITGYASPNENVSI